MAEAMIACFEIDLHNEHEARIWIRPPRQANVYLTKRPRDIVLVEKVLRIMPNLFVIYMIRDPRDMIVSKHGKAPEQYWAGLKFWKTYTPFGRRISKHPRVITVRYEDLATKPDQIQDEISARLPFLRKRAAFTRYHELAHASDASVKALGSVRPISPTSIGLWRQHLPRVAAQLEIHGSITADLIEFGYEQDDSWEKLLDGVEPDFSQSRQSEHFSQHRLRTLARGAIWKAIQVRLRHHHLYFLARRKLKALFGNASGHG